LVVPLVAAPLLFVVENLLGRPHAVELDAREAIGLADGLGVARLEHADAPPPVGSYVAGHPARRALVEARVHLVGHLGEELLFGERGIERRLEDDEAHGRLLGERAAATWRRARALSEAASAPASAAAWA